MARSRLTTCSPFGAEHEDVGFADALAEQIDAACRACDRIGDRRIGDQYVVGIGRQIDDDRLVEAELDALTFAVGADPRLVGEGGVAKLRQARAHGQKPGRKDGDADDAAGRLAQDAKRGVFKAVVDCMVISLPPLR